LHHLRHAKPYRCTNASCHRKEGFSTVNDLNRHLQTKHPGDLSSVIQSQAYHCLVFGCKSHDKIWPRQDNFRSHLKRMHRLPDDAMDFFIQQGRITGSQNPLDAGGMTQGIAPLQMESILLYLLTMETILLAQLFLQLPAHRKKFHHPIRLSR